MTWRDDSALQAIRSALPTFLSYKTFGFVRLMPSIIARYRPLRLPFAPARLPLTEMSWHGNPPISTSACSGMDSIGIPNVATQNLLPKCPARLRKPLRRACWPRRYRREGGHTRDQRHQNPPMNPRSIPPQPENIETTVYLGSTPRLSLLSLFSKRRGSCPETRLSRLRVGGIGIAVDLIIVVSSSDIITYSSNFSVICGASIRRCACFFSRPISTSVNTRRPCVFDLCTACLEHGPASATGSKWHGSRKPQLELPQSCTVSFPR